MSLFVLLMLVGLTVPATAANLEGTYAGKAAGVSRITEASLASGSSEAPRSRIDRLLGDEGRLRADLPGQPKRLGAPGSGYNALRSGYNALDRAGVWLDRQSEKTLIGIVVVAVLLLGFLFREERQSYH